MNLVKHLIFKAYIKSVERGVERGGVERVYRGGVERGGGYGATIFMSDVGPGGIVNGTHQDLSYIRCSIYYSADMISHI